MSPSSVGRGHPRRIPSLRKGGKELSDAPSDGADNQRSLDWERKQKTVNNTSSQAGASLNPLPHRPQFG
jgi:hypothetical protein